MGTCADYYAHQLFQHPSANEVQSYVINRGLTEEIVQTYQIGFAPAGWDNLIQHFRSEPTNRALLKTGMLTQNDNGRVYDRFRHRLMFPIRDVKGRVIAFGGRVMTPDEKPKYLNSPETPIFHKGQELYGLYEARKSLKNFDNIIIVEGYMDVVALAQHGVKNAVATLGTATSETHVQRLFKLTPEIVFCFDGDEAGRRAAIRALSNTLSELKDGLQAKFLFLPEGEDPDSIVRNEGHEGFMHRVKQAQSLPDFLFQHLQTQADVSRLDGKAKLASIAQGWIEKVPEGFIKQLLMSQLAETVGLSVDQITTNYRPEAPAIPEPAPTAPQPWFENQSPDTYNDYPNDYPDTQTDHYQSDTPYLTDKQRELAVRIGFTHRALAWLIRFPALAENVNLATIKKLPDTPDHQLLAKVVTLLQESRKKDIYFAFDYLCQHGLRETLAPIAASDYLWLEAANEDQQDEKEFARQELEKIIIALTHRAPDDEYESLKQRINARDPSLTDDEKQRYRKLLNQRIRK
jgi:DNA primase